MKEYTPKEIVQELDKYIISQDEAKRNVAISLRNRYRRKQIKDENLRNEITPKNVIFMGPTGVGKTEIARRLAKIVNAPFLKVEATKYTEVGYVGKDVESMIKDLVEIAYRDLKSKKTDFLIDKLKVDAENRVLKLLQDKYEENFTLEELINGKYDEYTIKIEKIYKNDAPILEMFPEDFEKEQMEEFFKNVVTKLSSKKESSDITVRNAIAYIIGEELHQELNSEELAIEALNKVEEDGIIFIDEIDKIAERGDGHSRGDVSRQGVQRDILPIIEGTTVITKYGAVKTDHILFIAAGAFSQASPSDLMPELQGRFPIKVKLNNLEKEDFIKILTKVKYNLLFQYKEILKIDNVHIKFTKGAIEKIAETSINLNNDVENIGARRLVSVIENLLKNLMFQAPFGKRIQVAVDQKFVKDIYEDKKSEEDLDNYIL